MSDDSALPLMPDSSASEVPVYNCIVLVQRTPSDATVSARVANLDGIHVSGASERDVLRSAVDAFREKVKSHRNAGETIPFRESPLSPEADEQQRFVPVHL